MWTRDFAVPLVERQLNVRSLEGFGLVGTRAQRRLRLAWCCTTCRPRKRTRPCTSIRCGFEEHSTALELDQVTVRNLELVEPLFAGQDDRATLFRTLDACQTPMGKRLLRATILRPLMDRRTIEARYEAVAEAHSDLMKREEMRRAFSGILDLERLLARISVSTLRGRATCAHWPQACAGAGAEDGACSDAGTLWRAVARAS